MKMILVLVSLMVSISSIAIETEIQPIVSFGKRFGEGNTNNQGATYASFKMNLFKSDLANFRTLNMMSLGLNYQDDKKWALSISPVSVSSMTGLTFGVDLMKTETDVKGGTVGLFIGYKFQ